MNTPNLFDLPEPKPCEHKRVTLILTPELIHYGKEICADCGKFVKWLARPADCPKGKTP